MTARKFSDLTTTLPADKLQAAREELARELKDHAGGPEAHDFILILSGDPLPYDDALYEAGLSDALLGVQDGVGFVDVTREAQSREAAIQSAVAQVESVGDLRVVGLCDTTAA